MIRITHGDRMVITEYGARFLKRDAMLTLVGIRLRSIPLEIHAPLLGTSLRLLSLQKKEIV
jgi:hypothetical protein